MAPVQLKLRKAMGVVKDQTSIQIAKVVGSPDLDVALVNATSHDEFPTEEKYMQELLHYVSYSRGYTQACIAGLSKRLSKTKNWIVALKALMVIHRLLRDGDPVFEQEINKAGSYGIRILNMAGFRDDSNSSDAWDYSAFVRTYSLFLDERLDCLSSSPSDKKGNSNRRSLRDRDDFRRSPGFDDSRRSSNDERRSSYDERRSPYDERRSTYDDWRSPRREGSERRRNGSSERDYDYEQKEEVNGDATSIKEMNPEMLLEKLPRLQRLLERVLGCRPTGAARINRLIQIALYAVIAESFQLHTDLSDGLARLRAGFFEMEHPAAVKAFDVYKRAGKQLQELSSFYALCKDIGVGRSSEYPSVTRVTPDQLDELEDHLRDGRSALVVRPKSPEPEPRPRSPSPERTYEDTMEMKALPAPPVVEPEPEPEPPVQTEADLLNLKEDALTAEQEEDKLALALFSSGAPGNGKWESFAPGERGNRPGMPVNFAEAGKEGWELALVESASNLAQAKGESLAGGFNPLLLDSMYEQAEANRAANVIPSGSESSVAATGASRPSSNVLALPAPQSVAMPGEDPFSASSVVPPPPYVQMADVLKKQQLLVQEQQMWQQYEMEGMRGYYSMMNVHNQNGSLYPQPQLALPYYNQETYRQFSYY
ncbi:unnamed protein product [Calypogeia fissa]